MQILDYLYQKDLYEPLVWDETGYYDHSAVEAQGSLGLRVDPVDVV